MTNSTHLSNAERPKQLIPQAHDEVSHHAQMEQDFPHKFKALAIFSATADRLPARL